MLRNYSAILFIFLLSTNFCIAETASNTILLKSRKIETANDFNLHINDVVNAADIYHGYYYRLIQFNNVLTEQQRMQVEATGVKLLGYLPYKTFYAAIPAGFNLSVLMPFNPRTIISMTAQDKMSNQLRYGNISDGIKNKNGTINITVLYYGNISPSAVKQELRNRGCTVLESFDESFQVSVSVKESDWQLLAACAFIKHIEPLSPMKADDTMGRSLHRSNAINTDYGAGRHYDGAGVSIALADDGEVGPHIDYTGRMTNMLSTGPGGAHGDMTSGICMGAGNLNPVIRGHATGSHIYIYDIGVYPPDTLAGSYPQVVDAAQHFADYGTVVLSTSYSAGCNDYDAFASMTDRIMHNLQVVCPIWSAGNNQGADCGYGAGGNWGNVTGGFKQGKNVVAVANLDAHEVIDATSSHGPAADGRIKPDISANGKDQMSIAQDNTFQVGGGTSAACPSVAGVTAQCYQAYREITGEANPDGALIKGCLLNSAWDIGTVGPDYAFGYGRINALRTVVTIEDHRYLKDSIVQGAAKTLGISIPSGMKQLKVMLIWSDPEGDANAAIALVNNLDLTVTDPGASTFNPWVLDPTPNATTLALPAVRGVDTLNNMEQVTIDNPAGGNYTVTINGTNVPFGPQKFYIVYDYWDDNITLTYPIGGEGFVPGETEVLRWDAFSTTGNFQLDYSTDNGTSWNSIGSVAGTERQYDWTVPNTVSGNCLVKVSRGVTNDVSDAPFSIVDDPNNLMVEWACVDSLKLTWDAVAGATGYEVSKLGAMYMDSIGTSATNSFVVGGITPIDTFWFSVRALTGGEKGRRAIAIRKLPGVFGCALANDISPQWVTSASSFNCISNANAVVSVEIQNPSANAASNFDISYSVNGGAPVTETYSGTVNAGSSAIYNFTATANFSALGSYQLRIYTSYATDQNAYNDTADYTFNVVAAIGAAPLVQDFEGVVFPPANWDTLNSNATYTWVRVGGVPGSSGTATNVAAFNNCGFDAAGAPDGLTTELIDISGIPVPLLTFDVSYQQWTGYVDALRVDVSDNCGGSFVPSGYYKEAPQLATVPAGTACFTPAQASDWRKDSVNLSAFAGGNISVRFVNIGHFGNWLYIDNVNIDDINVSTGTVSSLPVIGVYPNPSAGIFNLDLKNIEGNNLKAEVLDASGRVVEEMQLKNSSRIQATLNLSAQPSGIYYLRVSSDKKIYHLLMTKM